MTDLEKLLAEVTPGEWRVEDRTTLVWGDCNQNDTSTYGMGYPIAEARRTPSASWAKGPKDYEEAEANAQLIAMAPDLARKVIAAEKLAEALRLHQAWSDSEDTGPDYGEQSRDTHPDGERIWKQWWDGNLSLCGRAQDMTREAIAAWEAEQ